VAFAIDSKSLTSQGTGHINNGLSSNGRKISAGRGITTRIDLAGKMDLMPRRATSWRSRPKWLTG